MAQAVAPERTRALSIPDGSSALVILLTVLFIGLLVGAALYQLVPPAAVNATAPAEGFASGRAVKSLSVIAQKPHPVGSAEHARVRDYLVNELTALGLTPEVQRAEVVNPGRNAPFTAATIENIVARMKGTQTAGQAVLLAAHYDSATLSPGASDNGAGVVTLLETARALKAGTPLKRDVILLFTDGEELGLLGAQAFVEGHPWAKDVGVALNLEARGVNGPSMMFETSDGNGYLIDELADAAEYPVANSMSYEIYKALPNDTDMTVFKEAGWQGYNFAFIDGLGQYHTALDNISNLDERSLQHHGTYALALTRQLAGADGNIPRQTNAVYFNVFRWLIHYPQWLALPLVILSLLLFAAVVFVGLKRKALTLKGIGLGVLTFLVALLCAALTNFVASQLLQLLQQRFGLFPSGSFDDKQLYLVGFIALTIAAFCAVYVWFSRRTGGHNLLVGSLFWWLLISAVLVVLMPGGSYLLTWPLIFSLAALAFVMFSSKESDDASLKQPHRNVSLKHLAAFSIGVIPGMLLLIPLAYLIYVALGLGASLPITLIVSLLLGLLIPLLRLINRPNRWALPVVALVAGLGFIVAGGVSAKGGGQPKADHIFYGLNADKNQAVWASGDSRPDAWTSQFFAGDVERGALTEFTPSKTNFLQISAPVAQLPPPDVKLLNESRENEVRKLTMRVSSARQAPVLMLYFDSEAEVVDASINGRKAGFVKMPDGTGAKGKRWGIRYHALPAEGIEVVLQVKAEGPIKLRAVDQSYGLPQVPNFAYRERPPQHTPSATLPFSDSTLVTKSYTF